MFTTAIRSGAQEKIDRVAICLFVAYLDAMSQEEALTEEEVSAASEAAVSGDTEKLVRTACIAGCSAITGGIGAPFCAYAFGGGFEKTIIALFNLLPASWKAEGTACYQCVHDTILPVYVDYVLDGINSVNLSYRRSLLALGKEAPSVTIRKRNGHQRVQIEDTIIEKGEFDSWPILEEYLYAVPGQRWNVNHRRAYESNRWVDHNPAAGPWSIAWDNWPSRNSKCPGPDSDHPGCEADFARDLNHIYGLQLAAFNEAVEYALETIADRVRTENIMSAAQKWQNVKNKSNPLPWVIGIGGIAAALYYYRKRLF